MSKTRTKKRANSRLNMNYKPLSDSFCKSVVKGSSDKNKNNLEEQVYKSIIKKIRDDVDAFDSVYELSFELSDISFPHFLQNI